MGRLRSCAIARRRKCAASSRLKRIKPAAPGSIGQKVGGFLQELHRRGAHRVARHPAPCRRARGDRSHHRRSATCRRHSPAPRASAYGCPSRLVSSRTRAVRRICRARLAIGSRHARSRLLPANRRTIRGHPNRLHELHRQAVRARETAGAGGRGLTHRRARDLAGAGPVGSRPQPRPRRGLQQDDAAQLQAATPNFNWQAYFSGINGSQWNRSRRSSSVSLITCERLTPSLAATPLSTWKEYLTFGLLSSFADDLPAAFAEAQFEFNGKIIAGRQQMPPRWKRGVATVGVDARRAGGQAVRRPLLQGRREGPDGRAHQEPARRIQGRHRRTRVDVAGNEAAGAGQAREVLAEDRLPRSVARLLGARGEGRRSRRQRAALPRSSSRRTRGRASASLSSAGAGASRRRRSTRHTARPTTRSPSRPASFSRRSSTSTPTMRSTTVRSAR